MSWTRKAVAALTAAAALPAVWFVNAPAAHAATTPTCTPGGSYLSDVRTGAHTGFDRAVFDVSGSAFPTWAANLTTDNTYLPPSGEPKTYTIPGQQYLDIVFQGVTTWDPVTGAHCYTSPNPLTVNLPALKGVQETPDFEGRSDFGLSLDGVTSYQIYTLTAPNRIVVDIYY